MFNKALKNFRATKTTTKLLTKTTRPASAATFSTKNDDKYAPWEESKILLTGCQGQIGVPLVRALCEELGAENVIASDVSEQRFDFPCEYRRLDVTDEAKYMKMVQNNGINYIVHLAGILSALGEKNPDLAVDVNVVGMINATRAAQVTNSRLFVPSSIAVFGGDNFPKENTPVEVMLQPKTIYGVGKVFNEMMGEYYKYKFDMDFRSIRYPGVISSEKYAFNGTTDYSTEIFFHALENRHYTCWLAEETALPMIYIDDCIDATIKYLKADRTRLTRHCYNLAGISLVAGDFCRDVQRLIPDMTLDFEPDFRQQIAKQWPASIDDSDSLKDWDWSYDVTSFELAQKILDGIDPAYKTSLSEFEQTSSEEETETPAFRKLALTQ